MLSLDDPSTYHLFMDLHEGPQKEVIRKYNKLMYILYDNEEGRFVQKE